MCDLRDDDVKKIDDWAGAEVAKAVQFAEESDVPDPAELFSDVMA
jgi:TPP-dependent pyruvate/acetoin dehydrogenase alpha subunit